MKPRSKLNHTIHAMSTNTQPTAAQMIRGILKTEFPKQKFSVTSDYNSIRIRYTDGVASEMVEELTNPFIMGHFNGMEDIYEYSNRNKDLPQVKYIFVEREMSADAKAAILKDFDISEPETYYGEKQIYNAFQKVSF